MMTNLGFAPRATTPDAAKVDAALDAAAARAAAQPSELVVDDPPRGRDGGDPTIANTLTPKPIRR
jgi:hypothetical protein